MLKEKVIGKSRDCSEERQLGIRGVKTELYVLQGYTEILSVYGIKEKQSSEQLPPPRNVLETRSTGLHRRETVANVVSRTDIQNTVRDENAFVQNNLSLDRRKILAFYFEKSAKERKNP